MSKNYYDFLIDLALDTKDYKWLQELQDSKLTKNDNEVYFNLTDIALDNIDLQYGIKEDNGIRKMNYSSEYDIYQGNIVYLEQNSYKKHDIIKYKILEEEESYFVRGIFVGHLQAAKSYEEGYNVGYKKGYKSGFGYSTELNKIDKTIESLDTKQEKKKWWKFWDK